MVAYANPSPALPSASHPMANPGYGKRPAIDTQWERPWGEGEKEAWK